MIVKKKKHNIGDSYHVDVWFVPSFSFANQKPIKLNNYFNDEKKAEMRHELSHTHILTETQKRTLIETEFM